MKPLAPVWLALAGICTAQEPFEPIPRRIPPAGLEIPAAVRTELAGELTRLQKIAENLDHPRKSDAGVF